MVFILQVVHAQDRITKRSGESIQAKVLEVAQTEIRYKRFESPEGPTYVIAKNEVLLIEYADGTNGAFKLEEPEAAAPPRPTKPQPAKVDQDPSDTSTPVMQLYQQGAADAYLYYDDYKSAGTGVLVVSLVSPLLGLVPAIGASGTPPQLKNMDTPNQQMLKEPDYVKGYQKTARKIKSGKVWKNWGIAFGVNLLAVIILVQQ